MTWTWTNVYLVCFLLGFSLSAVSWLFGALHLHLHLPHVGHGHKHGGASAHAHSGHGSHSAHAGHGASIHSAPSPFNVATLTAFLAWFGGAGYLLTRYADLWPLAALLLAIIVGCVGASVIFWFMAKV